ncbi:porin [Undibacterium squillarum]|uniref:Porin n=1 Tax=Undibacterium squillarum TaxID=1131567 RepID=A0ABQ2XZY7_9BURK|nr:porin [Undibacterium squillarum]GGX47356.1 porin [Undibacterium squillarum]
MKKLALAAALAMIGGTAAAQSNVTIYGLLDVNASYNNGGDANGGKQFKVGSGGMNTSRWGLRGSEDLGNGLKAIMQLEGGIVMDTGAADGDIFGRQANVGLQGDFGKVVVGRSYSTTYDFLISYDPMGYAPNYSWATSAGATGSRKDGMMTTVSNLIKYQYDGKSSDFSYKFGASYAAGETVGNTSAGAKYILAGALTAGPASAVATYEKNNAALAANGQYDQSTVMHLAGSYDFGVVKGFAGYRNFKKTLASGAAEQRSDTYWLGANYAVAPNWTLTGTYYAQNIKNMAAGKDADPSMLVARAKYALSKRTDLYVSAAYAKAKNGLATGVSRDDAGFTNSQSGATIGMQHRF